MVAYTKVDTISHCKSIKLKCLKMEILFLVFGHLCVAKNGYSVVIVGTGLGVEPAVLKDF